MLSHHTLPYCIAANILTICESLNPNFDMVSALSSVSFTRDHRSVNIHLTKRWVCTYLQRRRSTRKSSLMVHLVDKPPSKSSSLAFWKMEDLRLPLSQLPYLPKMILHVPKWFHCLDIQGRARITWQMTGNNKENVSWTGRSTVPNTKVNWTYSCKVG